MNKANIFANIISFSLGTFAGNEMGKSNASRLARNEKLKVSLPSSTEDIVERFPKAISAAAKELVDERTIDIKTGKEIERIQ